MNGLVQPAGGLVRHGEVAGRLEGVLMVNANPLALPGQDGFIELNRLGGSARLQIDAGEISHRQQRAGVVGSKLDFHRCNRRLLECNSLRQLACLVIHGGERVGGIQHIGMLLGKSLAVRGERRFRQGDRAVGLAGAKTSRRQSVLSAKRVGMVVAHQSSSRREALRW